MGNTSIYTLNKHYLEQDILFDKFQMGKLTSDDQSHEQTVAYLMTPSIIMVKFHNPKALHQSSKTPLFGSQLPSTKDQNYYFEFTASHKQGKTHYKVPLDDLTHADLFFSLGSLALPLTVISELDISHSTKAHYSRLQIFSPKQDQYKFIEIKHGKEFEFSFGDVKIFHKLRQNHIIMDSNHSIVLSSEGQEAKISEYVKARDKGRAFRLECCPQVQEILFNQLRRKYAPVISLREVSLNADDLACVSICLSMATVKELYLERNSLKGLEALSEPIRKDSALIKLSVLGNSLSDSQLRVLSGGISVSNIALLNLSNNEISDEGVDHLMNCFDTDRNLKILDLSGNPIKDKGLIAISRKLPQIKCLKLNRTGPYSDLAFANFSTALEKSQKTKKIDLAFCGLRPIQLRFLFNGLYSNQALCALCLDGNPVDCDGFKALGDAMKANRILKEISLMETGVDLPGFKHLLKGLACNLTIKYISIDQEKLPEGAGLKEFNDCLAANRDLCELNEESSQFGLEMGSSSKSLNKSLTLREKATKVLKTKKSILSTISEDDIMDVRASLKSLGFGGSYKSLELD